MEKIFINMDSDGWCLDPCRFERYIMKGSVICCNECPNLIKRGYTKGKLWIKCKKEENFKVNESKSIE